MADYGQNLAHLAEKEEQYAVFHLVSLKEKRRMEEYFKRIGVEISSYCLTISKEPGDCEPVRVHSIFIKNPSDLKIKLLKARNNFLVRNMKIVTHCGPRETIWSRSTEEWTYVSKKK